MASIRYIFSGLDSIGPAPRRFLVFLVFNVTSWECLIGSVLILHARALGIAPSWVGVLTAIIPFTMLITLFMKPVAERYGSKRLMIKCWTARVIAVSPIIFTPLVFARWGTSGAAVILFATVALYCFFRSLGSIGWMPWLHEIIPADRRGLYTGVEAMIVRLALIILGLIIYLILGEHPPLWKFSAVSIFGIMLGVISLVLIRNVPGGEPYSAIHHSERKHLAEYRAVLRDSNFRSFFLCAATGTFAYMGYNLLMMLFMREQLAIAPGRIMLIATSGSLATALTVQRWGRIADTHGSPATMAAAAALVFVCLLLCTTLQPGRLAAFVIFPVFAALNLATAGVMIASGRGLLHRARPELRHAYSALWTTGTSIFSGLASIMTGLVLNTGTSLVYLFSFIGFAVLMGGICLACLKLPESGIDHAVLTYPLFLPRRPVISMLRMYSYILRPARTHELHPQKKQSQ